MTNKQEMIHIHKDLLGTVSLKRKCYCGKEVNFLNVRYISKKEDKVGIWFNCPCGATYLDKWRK